MKIIIHSLLYTAMFIADFMGKYVHSQKFMSEFSESYNCIKFSLMVSENFITTSKFSDMIFGLF